MTRINATSRVTRMVSRRAGTAISPRDVPEETPIALSYGGTTHAVMMASPADLEDFAAGFSVTEGIVSSIDEIESMDVEELTTGIDLQIRLRDSANKRFTARRRHLAGPVGCGLCGIESIEEAMRAVRPVECSDFTLPAEEVSGAFDRLSEKQALFRATGAVHAAGLYRPSTGISLIREDVGRHNALDKLAGALARKGEDAHRAMIVLTSRVSVEMIQKSAAIGAPVVAAISAPTALAIRMAEEAGITLVALVRGEEFDIFTHPERIIMGASRHVA